MNSSPKNMTTENKSKTLKIIAIFVVLCIIGVSIWILTKPSNSSSKGGGSNGGNTGGPCTQDSDCGNNQLCQNNLCVCPRGTGIIQ